MIWAITDAARLLEVAGVNLILSGDNAIVVAMAIRQLPEAERKIASIAGISGALMVQAIVTLTLASLLEFPAISVAGGILLGFIAIRLLRENSEGGLNQVLAERSTRGLHHSILLVVGAYLVMCLDNILAIAAVGHGHPAILVFGILLSGALMVPASLLIANLMKKYPITLKVGAGLLGWTAGSMIAVIVPPFSKRFDGQIAQIFIPAMMTVVVVTSSWWWPRSHGPQPG